MNRKRQDPTPDPEQQKASELVGLRLSQLIGLIQQIAPELTHTEALYLTAAILKQLPLTFGNNPFVIAQIRQQARQIVSER